MAKPSVNRFRAALLRWYDVNARSLPWRVTDGEKPDPYRIWLSEIMLQQTTIATVIPYYTRFITRWPTLPDLADAPLDDILRAWAGLGYYSRARNLHRCAQTLMTQHDGMIPPDLPDLMTLPGIGDYTANAIRAIAFDLPATVIDGNVERVVARLFAVTDPLPAAKKIVRVHAHRLSDQYTDRPGAFAQAMMDLGSTVCTPRTPSCGICPVRGWCKGADQGIAASLPRKAPPIKKPQRHGVVYWVTNRTGQVLTCKGPQTGLLAGMDALPCTPWEEGSPKDPSVMTLPDILKGQTALPTTIRIKHVFSHFDLSLAIARIHWSGRTNPRGSSRWVPKNQLGDLAWPALYRKVIIRMIEL